MPATPEGFRLEAQIIRTRLYELEMEQLRLNTRLAVSRKLSDKYTSDLEELQRHPNFPTEDLLEP